MQNSSWGPGGRPLRVAASFNTALQGTRRKRRAPELRRYAAIAWNDQAGELFVGWLDTGAEQPNLLEFVFLSERARDLLVDWPERTRRLLAEFRADFNRDPGDVRLQALAESLAERSRDFERIWRSQEVLNRDGGVRTFSHPERGESQFFQTTFHLASHAGVKLVCLLPLCHDADQCIGDASDQA